MLRQLGAVLTLFGFTASLAGIHDLAFILLVPPRPSSRHTSLSFPESIVYSAIGLTLIVLGVHLLYRRTPTAEEWERAAEERRQRREQAARERRDSELGIWDRTCWRSLYSSRRD